MSLLSRLKSEGVLLLHHDYRNGSYQDLSGNGKHGTPTVCELRKGALRFSSATGAEVDAGTDTLGAGAGSVFFWCKPNSYGESSTGWVFENEVLRVYNQSPERLNIRIITATTTPSNSFLLNKDNLVVLTWDSSGNLDAWANGSQVITGSGLGSPSAGGKFRVGNRAVNDRQFDGDFYAVGAINRELTPAEVTELTAELMASKPDVRGLVQGVSGELPNESGVTALYSMPSLQDYSGNGYNLTKSGTVSSQKTRIGESSSTDGVHAGELQIPLTAWPGTTGAIEMVANVRSGTDNGRLFGSEATGSHDLRAYSNLDGRMYFYATNAAGTVTPNTTTDFAWNQPHHIVFEWEYDGSTNTTFRLFVDGDLKDSDTLAGTVTTPNIGFQFFNWRGLDCDGLIHSAAFHNVARTEAEWLERSKAFHRRSLVSLGNGARVTTSNLSAGQQVPGTPFYVSSGTWSVGVETVNGKPSKVLTCETAGIVYTGWNELRNTPGEAAYGTWEWWDYKDNAADLFVTCFCASEPVAYNDAAIDGYFLWNNTSSRDGLNEVSSGVRSILGGTAILFNSPATWYKRKITRSPAGLWTFYRDDVLVDTTGGSGSNPVTDTTHTTGKYITFEMYAGNKLALATLAGEPLFRKYYGVV